MSEYLVIHIPGPHCTPTESKSLEGSQYLPVILRALKFENAGHTEAASISHLTKGLILHPISSKDVQEMGRWEF